MFFTGLTPPTTVSHDLSDCLTGLQLVPDSGSFTVTNLQLCGTTYEINLTFDSQSELLTFLNEEFNSVYDYLGTWTIVEDHLIYTSDEVCEGDNCLSLAGELDPLTVAFLAVNTGVTDTGQISALDAFAVNIRSHGLIPKLLTVYPMVGGTSTTHKYNFINPATFELSFVGGWIHSATGAKPNGINAYANGNFNPSIEQSVNSASFGCYSRTEDTTGTQVTGVFDSSTNFLHQNNISQGNFVLGEVSSLISYTPSPTTRLLMCSRTSSTQFYAYRDGSSLGSSIINAVGLPNFNTLLGARNDNGTPVLYSSHEIAFQFEGLGLTPTDVTNFTNALNALQTALSRNV